MKPCSKIDCTRAGQLLPETEFYRFGVGKLHSQCKRCFINTQKKYAQTAKGRATQRRIDAKRIKNPVRRQRQADLLRVRSFGLTTEAYDDRLQRQRGRCAICDKPGRLSRVWSDGFFFAAEGVRERLHVDHEHVEGFDKLPPEQKVKFIRGLICRNCNLGLGNLPTAEVLRRAIDYLESYLQRKNAQ